jgi:SIR2-like protein
MGILDKFIDAIGADPANCVLVVGSGLLKQGVRAGGKGLPDWDELMRLMVHDLDESKRCPAAAIAQFRTWLTEDPPRYLDIADAFRKVYTHDLDGYERFLRRHLRPDDLADSQLHRLILGIGFKGIVSYNFDLVFEKQSDRLDKIVYPDLLEQIGHFRRKGYFAKIHGCIDRPATQLVLTGNSFHELSSNPNYTRLFEAIFLANWVLCVGFSLRDPDFQSILANLKECWDTHFPPVLALMREPCEQVCADWLSKGVDILPYTDHSEVNMFFQQLAERCGTRRARPRLVGNGGSSRRRRTTARFSTIPPTIDTDAKDLQEFIEEWQGEQKVAAMDTMMSQHLSRLRDATEREEWLFRVAAMCRLRDRTHLCHHLIAVGTPACLDLARQLLRVAAQEDEFRTLSPDRVHLPVHQFVLADSIWQLEKDGTENLLKWLLEADWAKHGVDLTVTFRHLLSCILNSRRERKLDSLYIATEQIPGAAAEIEKIALSGDFPRRHDRVETSWDKHVVENIKQEKLRRLFSRIPGSSLPPQCWPKLPRSKTPKVSIVRAFG